MTKYPSFSFRTLSKCRLSTTGLIIHVAHHFPSHPLGIPPERPCVMGIGPFPNALHPVSVNSAPSGERFRLDDSVESSDES